jgi:glycosyltransferase involved in cell wall biosynthesis
VLLGRDIFLGKRVSVIVPTFQRSSLLDSVLFPSILRQSFPPAEIIVVDDTPDDSVKTVSEKWQSIFGNSHITMTFFRNPKQRSATLARNLGASKASGELFTFLDSDLELDGEYLRHVQEIFGTDKKAVGVQGHIVNPGDFTKVQGLMRITRDPKGALYKFLSAYLREFAGFTMPSVNSCQVFEYPFILEKTIQCNWLSGSNMTVERNAFNLTQFDPNLLGYGFGDDVLISSQLSRLGALYITPWSKCKHFDAPTGRTDTTNVSKELYFFRRMFGIRGFWIYCNRRILFALLKASKILQ